MPINGEQIILTFPTCEAIPLPECKGCTEYNQQAKKRGVKRVILKDLQFIDEFAKKVVKEVEQMITSSRLLHF